MSVTEGIDKPPHLSDQALVPDTATLAQLLGHHGNSATAHLLAACESGGYSDHEALRQVYPEVVRAWEVWRRYARRRLWEVPTAGDVRTALETLAAPPRTPVRGRVASRMR